MAQSFSANFARAIISFKFNCSFIQMVLLIKFTFSHHRSRYAVRSWLVNEKRLSGRLQVKHVINTGCMSSSLQPCGSAFAIISLRAGIDKRFWNCQFVLVTKLISQSRCTMWPRFRRSLGKWSWLTFVWKRNMCRCANRQTRTIIKA